MSNIADIHGKTPPLSPSVEEVLERVAAAAGAKSDASLARALCVSPQTLSSWRKRGTVPHEAVVSFASKSNLPLDYLLLGKGPARRYDGIIDPLLLEAIGWEIEELSKAAGKRPMKLGGALLAYYGAIVYNRISRIARREDNPFDFVPAEVKYLMDLLARENADAVAWRLHPEVARHLEGTGANLGEVFAGARPSKPIVDIATGPSQKATKSRAARSKRKL